ncbi:u3 snornp-associated protein esf2 [Grosmannia clavigera kw1407]|uniref:18S rRNA factor 2 n=1 Tax=Grosmannia clavigera (strain kw1407 / UAMH 11150) TaxID=655863 RepID=F0XSY5_GROCL|nr:u3 snornp-associated protein esf2 [Grosmannia clavigera kw1407]EFW99301.1 u3 snornp-associated protein esf2 [Grosmannia clavigera kw1407]
MAADKRNVYLDVEDSDEDDNQSYDSEADELRKGNDRSSKRRKVQKDGDDDDDDDEPIGGRDDDAGEEDGLPNEAGPDSTRNKKRRRKSVADEGDADEDDEADKGSSKKRKRLDSAGNDLPGVSKPLTKKNLVASEKAVQRSGVMYLSRVPPFMKPIKLRSLLSPYGTINRIFLSPEDPLSHARRVRGGGNKKRSFVDGWVEFVRKRDAKRAVDLLNGHAIGGKKSSYYRDDLWNVVYLRGFKWHHLTEQITTENAERAGRMRAEIAQSTRENKEFVRNVERAKMLDGIEAKTAEKKKRSTTQKEAGHEDRAPPAPAPAADTKEHKNSRTFTFKQTTLVSRKDKDQQPEQVKRVLSKIF